MTLIAYRDNKFRRHASKGAVVQANQIIAEAAADGWHSMTLRQLYYQFVARGFIPNTVQDYKRLGRIVTDARYCGLISWTAIEDAGRNSYHFPEKPTAEDVLAGIDRKLTIDPWADQDVYVEVWVEKQALEATVARPCGLLNTPYMACKGYLSASEAWRAGLRFQRAIDRGKRPVLLHLGDHDPSGIDMTRDNGDRLGEFVLQGVEVRRIALNMDQVQEHNPPPNPAKEDDSRFRGYRELYGEESWELDALRQNTIGDIITSELRTFIDQARWDASMAEQVRRREPLRKLQEQWPDVEAFLSRTDGPLRRLGLYDAAMDMGAQLDTGQFLDWLSDRLVSVYKESENVDFVRSLKARSEALKNARKEELE